jgi:hydrogenase expression/formation protein HypC
MCLAVPARLTSVRADEATVDLRGTSVRISTVLVPDAVRGDWVLVHAGFAIQRLDEEEARKTFSLLDELTAANGGVT